MNNSPDSSDYVAPKGMALLPSLVYQVPARLGAISPEVAAAKSAPAEWSMKEELGHLIDSATVNHQRVVRTIFENQPALYGYDGDAWVRLHQYQEANWLALITRWETMNSHLLCALEGVTDVSWRRACTIADAEPITLAFLVDDYVDHMLGHLRHIGVEVDDLISFGADGRPPVYPEKPASADHWINDLMERRWSPRVFDVRTVEGEKILALLEAARWAPSCFNEQPWSYLVFDGSDSAAMARARDCLVEGNAWAREAPVLMLSVARETFAKNDKPNRWAQHDVGLASENLVLMAVELGLAAHQMAGFDAERAEREFGIPEGFTPMAMIAIGYPRSGGLDAVEEKARARELAPRDRKPIGEIGFAGVWGARYGGG